MKKNCKEIGSHSSYLPKTSFRISKAGAGSFFSGQSAENEEKNLNLEE